jgi:hypothetical protein
MAKAVEACFSAAQKTNSKRHFAVYEREHVSLQAFKAIAPPFMICSPSLPTSVTLIHARWICDRAIKSISFLGKTRGQEGK